MMTTGYDCQDILNLCMMRPIFSPTDFIQIKGRGTRKFTFPYKTKINGKTELLEVEKEHFKLFDFFANCEYFEEKYDYDEIIRLPAGRGKGIGEMEPTPGIALDQITLTIPDPLALYSETPIGLEGMEIDRQLFGRLAKPVKKDEDILKAIEHNNWDQAIRIFRERYEDKPELYVTLEKLRKSEGLDRRLSWREVLERIFGIIDRFKTREEMLDEQVSQFIAVNKPDNQFVQPIRNFMKAYLTDAEIRRIIDEKEFAKLATNPKLSMADLQAMGQWRESVPDYIKDYIVINTYLN
jgi:type I restriction enzyme R subunit